MTTDNGADYKWKVVNPGIYVVSVNLTANTITVTPDWTDIGTADQLVAFAESVNSATDINYDGGRWARLTADIDMAGKTFPGIGTDSKYTRYHGTFDGQGHKISNLSMTSDYCAFITVAGGGCTVKNLLIDETCSFNGTGRVAGIISAVNYTDFGNPLTIINCGNEADITGTGKNCAGRWTRSGFPQSRNTARPRPGWPAGSAGRVRCGQPGRHNRQSLRAHQNRP